MHFFNLFSGVYTPEPLHDYQWVFLALGVFATHMFIVLQGIGMVGGFVTATFCHCFPKTSGCKIFGKIWSRKNFLVRNCYHPKFTAIKNTAWWIRENKVGGLTLFMLFVMLLEKCYFEMAGISEAINRDLEAEDPFILIMVTTYFCVRN